METCYICDSEAITECMVTGRPLCEFHARRGGAIAMSHLSGGTGGD